MFGKRTKKDTLTLENIYLFETLIINELPGILKSFINNSDRPKHIVTIARKQLALAQSGLAKIVDDINQAEVKEAQEKTMYLQSKFNAFNLPANSLTLRK